MLTADIMNHFGIEKDWEAVGFFETAEHRQLATNVRNAMGAALLKRRRATGKQWLSEAVAGT